MDKNISRKFKNSKIIYLPTFILMSALALNACSNNNNTTPTPPPPPPPPIKTIALTTFQSATVVIGQTDFTGSLSNQGGGSDANTISSPYGNPGVADSVLYLPDSGNSRLLGFNTVPSVNNTNANFVLGQSDFITTTPSVAASKFNSLQNIVFAGGKMFLTDYGNHRVLIWNSIPTSGGIPANVVLGQPNFDTATIRVCTATSFIFPETLWAANGKLIVTDTVQNRVLIWKNIPATNATPPDLVLGQQDFTHCAKNDTNNDGQTDVASAQTLSRPAGVWSDGTRLVIIDNDNNRVLIWNTFPVDSFTAADVVLGQEVFTKTTANDDNQNDISDIRPTARTLNRPYSGVYSNGIQLFIADYGNNRVLIWNSFPTSNFTPADVVLGQGDFTHATLNDDNQNDTSGAATARTMNLPTGIIQYNNQLFVGEAGNSRYLIYNGN